MKKCLFVIGLLIFANSLFGKNYFLRNYAEYEEVYKKFKAGDTVTLANGIWTDVTIVFKANGTKDLPVLLKAETNGQVIFSGKSNMRISGDYITVEGFVFKNGYVEENSVIEFRTNSWAFANHSRLTNCSIESYNPPDKWADTKWISLYGTHNRVDHNSFIDKKNQGCLLVVWLDSIPDHHLIDSNYFGPREELGENGAEIIRIGTSDWAMFSSYTTVTNNYFYRCNGEREIISNKSWNNSFIHNTFVECKGCLTLRHGNYGLVEGNFFFGNHVKGTGGVRIIGENHRVLNNYFQDLEGDDVFAAIAFMNGVKNSPLTRYFQVKNALVAFNTIINCKRGFAVGTGKDNELSLPPVDSRVANNIVKAAVGPIVKYIDTPENFHWVNNIFFGASIGIDAGNGISVIDPQVALADDGLWRPLITSPAIENAAPIPEIQHDIDGQPRIAPGDVGCDQHSNEPKKFRPMKTDDVGPRWMMIKQ